MLPILEKAVEVLIKLGNDPDHNPDTFLESMDCVEKALGPEGWQELSGLSMFNIAKSITFGDVIRLAKSQEP